MQLLVGAVRALAQLLDAIYSIIHQRGQASHSQHCGRCGQFSRAIGLGPRGSGCLIRDNAQESGFAVRVFPQDDRRVIRDNGPLSADGRAGCLLVG
jgi:hypothetical protein